MKLKHACDDAGQYGLNVSPDEYRDQGIRLLRTSDLADGRLADPSEGVYLDGPVDSRYQVLQSDLLLSRAGTIGRSYLVPPAAAGSTFAGFLVRFRPTPAQEPRFLNYSIQSRLVQGQISADAVTSTIQNFNADRYANLDLPDASLSEQRRIADFLDDRVARIDQIIAARREQQRLAREAHSTSLQRVFDTLVGRFGEGRLGFGLARMEQGWSPQAEAVPAELGEWGVMRAGCVNGGVFNAADNKRLPEGLEPVRSYEIRAGDLLMSRASGSLDLIGSVAVVPDHVRDCLLLCDKVYRLTPLPGWHAEFLAPMLRVRRNRELIRLGTSGAEGMANNLPSGVVRGLMVPLAPSMEQLRASAEAAAEATKVEGVVESLAKSIDLLTEYKQSLITAAVTGELDVTTAGSGIPG